MSAVACKQCAEVIHYESQVKVPHITYQINEDITSNIIEETNVTIHSIPVDLMNKTKATYNCLSHSGSKFSQRNCPASVKDALLGKKATYDEAKSMLSMVTSRIRRDRHILMSSTVAVSNMKYIFQLPSSF